MGGESLPVSLGSIGESIMDADKRWVTLYKRMMKLNELWIDARNSDREERILVALKEIRREMAALKEYDYAAPMKVELDCTARV